MNKDYIYPSVAIKKMRIAKELKQTTYICGATGFGKTELVKHFLENQNYTYISCVDNSLNNDDIIPKPYKNKTYIVVIDDMHLINDELQKQKILSLIQRNDIWLIMICRSNINKWIMQSYMKNYFLIINENDLKLNQLDIEKYLSLYYNISLNKDDLEVLTYESQGNALIVKHTAIRLIDGKHMDSDTTKFIFNMFANYLESSIIVQWDTELLDFLLQVSIVDEFDLKLAEFITGNSSVGILIDKAFETGNFIENNNGIYKIRKVALIALRNYARKIYSTKQINEYFYNAGLYYETQNMIVLALQMYEKSGNYIRIENLLIQNARKNPSSGYYFELRRYYLQLSDDDITNSAILMSALSMLYSLLMQVDKSEYWYNKLKEYEKKSKGGQKREAIIRIAYLDIALPHRGSLNLIEIFKSVSILLFDKKIKLPEFSVTSNLPSNMNGGKDFCHWSKKDKELANTIGKLIEKILGRYGKGLINIALGESFYEKGEDSYEVLSLISKAEIEIEAGGMLEMAFVSVGLQVRLNIVNGNCDVANSLIKSFEKKVLNEKATRMLPNIYAMKCRIDLYTNNDESIMNWIKSFAPDETKEFFIMERYAYITKIRCYIYMGEYFKAFSLIEKLNIYAKQYGREYILMEIGILKAIVKYRSGSNDWTIDFIETLKKISSYQFIRIISEECSAVYEILEKVKNKCLSCDEIDKKWFKKVLVETRKTSIKYTKYLKKQVTEVHNFSETALNILRLQSIGLSNTQISEQLDIKSETVRYHVKQNYKKLQVSNKTDAIVIARKLRLL